MLLNGAVLEVSQAWAAGVYVRAWLPWPMTPAEAAAVLAAGAWPSGALVDEVNELDPLRVLAAGGAGLAVAPFVGVGPGVGPMMAM